MSTQVSVAELLDAVVEVYQPIYGHPELSTSAARASSDRLEHVMNAYRALSAHAGRALRVLDLGCAQGYFGLSLAALGAKVHGVDMNATNVAICNALAREHALDATFEQAMIEDFLRRDEESWDLVLGLSVFHHLVLNHGFETVRSWIAALGTKVMGALFELALQREPMSWAVAQPADESSLLDGFALVHELGRFATHLSTVERPLYYASNRVWCFGDRAAEFTRWTMKSHEGVGEVHCGTRRYFENEAQIAKQFLLRQPLADVNSRDLDAEARFLREPPVAGDFPRLLAYGSNRREAWLVRDRIPGTLLSQMMAAGEPYDARRVIRDVLAELCELERAGLYHADVRTWNTLVSASGHARLLDFGAVGFQPEDCVWPTNPFLAFWIFVREVASGVPARIEPLREPFISPYRIPEEFRPWALAAWSLPPEQWSYAAMLRMLDEDARSPAPQPGGSLLWMEAMERHADLVAQQAGEVRARLQRLEDALFGADGGGAATAAAFVKGLGAIEQELERVRQQLAEQRARQDQFEGVARELGASNARLAEVSQQLGVTQRELASTTAAYEVMRNSRSWRITRPLRDMAVLARRLRGDAPAQPEKRPKQTRRAGVVASLVAYVNADPQRKQRVARWLRLVGPLDRRLRALARAQGVESFTSPADARAWSVPRPSVANAAQRELMRRIEYLTQLEDRLDAQQSEHEVEVRKLTQELERLRAARR